MTKIQAVSGNIHVTDNNDRLMAIFDWQSVSKPSDELLSSSTTLQPDDELFFATVPGGVYELSLYLVYSNAAGSAPGLKIAFGEDANPRGSLSVLGLDPSDAPLAAGFAVGNTNQSIKLGTSAASRGALVTAVYWGGGRNARLSWSQAVSDPSPTVVRAGSQLRYRKIT